MSQIKISENERAVLAMLDARTSDYVGDEMPQGFVPGRDIAEALGRPPSGLNYTAASLLRKSLIQRWHRNNRPVAYRITPAGHAVIVLDEHAAAVARVVARGSSRDAIAEAEGDFGPGGYFRSGESAGEVVRDAGGTVLRGPSLPCGCPLDADCTGYHPGRL